MHVKTSFTNNQKTYITMFRQRKLFCIILLMIILGNYLNLYFSKMLFETQMINNNYSL